MQIPDYNNISIPEATALQNELRPHISLKSELSEITTIAGADISHNKNEDVVYAGIVLLNFPQLEVLSYSLVKARTKFPYIPGYLGFREVPALLEAWQMLPEKPDVLILDGQGITHPRKTGIAAHFGVLSGQASIGCAKNMLFGNYEPPLPERLRSSPIISNGEIIGYALRTKDNVSPVFISPGHKISVADSLQIMKQCVLSHRIPEPTRLAHDTVNRFRTGMLQEGFYRLDIPSV